MDYISKNIFRLLSGSFFIHLFLSRKKSGCNKDIFVSQQYFKD